MSNFLDQVERIANGINTTTSPEVLKNWVEIQLILAYKAGLDRAMEAITTSLDVAYSHHRLDNVLIEEEANNG